MPTRTTEVMENGNLQVTIPWHFCNRMHRKKIIIGDAAGRDDPFLLTIARGRRWQAYIDEGRFRNVKELAVSIGRDPGNVAFATRTAMLAPKVIHRFISGNIPASVTLETLRHPLPEEWDAQYEAIFGKEQ